MSDDEITRPDTTIAKLVYEACAPFFERLERAIDSRLTQLEHRVLLASSAYEHRVRECEREIANLKEIVYGEDFQRVLRFARAAGAETERPPEL